MTSFSMFCDAYKESFEAEEERVRTTPPETRPRSVRFVRARYHWADDHPEPMYSRDMMVLEYACDNCGAKIDVFPDLRARGDDDVRCGVCVHTGKGAR